MQENNADGMPSAEIDRSLRLATALIDTGHPAAAPIASTKTSSVGFCDAGRPAAC